MKFAVIKMGGKQYKVSEGDQVDFERLSLKENDSVNIPDVLLYTDENKTLIGDPILKNVSVSGKIIAHVRGEKIYVSKYKSKVRYRRRTGHRQDLSKVLIEKITEGKSEAKDKKEIKKEAKK